MRRLLLSSAIILALTAAGGHAYRAAADTDPGADQQPGPAAGGWDGPGDPGPRGPGGWGPGGRGPGRGGPGGPPGFGRGGDGKFSLFAPVKNKNLSVADVKIIATALLLEHGNHDWGVSNVVAEPDKSIDFSFTTTHGDVIASFAIDPATGRIQRVS